MNDRVVADFNVRQIGQTNIFDHAAKVDFAHPRSVVLEDLFQLVRVQQGTWSSFLSFVELSDRAVPFAYSNHILTVPDHDPVVSRIGNGQ